MPAHPKPLPRAKKPGAMRSKPSVRHTLRKDDGVEMTKAQVSRAAIMKGSEVIQPATGTLTKPHAARAGMKATKAPRAPKKPPRAKPEAPAGQSKTDLIISMLKTSGGATSKELEAATGWAPHSVRGLLGTLRKRGVKVTSTKLPKEPTIYRISAADPIGDVV